MLERRARRDFIVDYFGTAAAGFEDRLRRIVGAKMMQLPCRSLGKVPVRLAQWNSNEHSPAANEMERCHSESERCCDPGRCFRNRHRRDFPVTVTEVEFDGAWAVPSKRKVAQVPALIGGKDEPVGRTASDCVRGAGPVIDC